MFSNFIFDNKSNKLLGLICVRFDSVSGAETFSGGCETEVITEKTPRSNKFYIIEQPYSAPMQFTFQVINEDGTPITPQKERSIKKWLCQRGTYKLFQIDSHAGLYYNVNISNPKLINVGDTVGMEFVVITDSPFGYSPIQNRKFSITSLMKQATLLIDHYDDYLYPTVTITMLESGNLEITNSTEQVGRFFRLNNVVTNEVITIDSEMPDISSSIPTHNIFADFNKNWIRLVDGMNTLTFNLNCNVTITYREHREVGVY